MTKNTAGTIGELSPTVLRSQRQVLKISQSALGRMSGVKRVKIHLFEHADVILTAEEKTRIWAALQHEVKRLHGVTINFEPKPAAETAEAPVGA
jgi:hypothetical protein